jgi:DNA-binding PadR family transcriptional regulator
MVYYSKTGLVSFWNSIADRSCVGKRRMPISTLGNALLSLLARKPRSGYDLVQYMKRPIGYFWHARSSQIYAELLRLETQILVTYQVIEQHDRPNKKLYTITQEGRAALRQWATEPVEVTHDRNELALKAYTIWLADPEQAIRLFRTQEDAHATKLAHYEAILARLEQGHGPQWRVDEPLFGDYATLHLGIGYEREYTVWCRWMAEQLEQHLGQKD